MQPQKIVLIGGMGAGKSTIGNILSKKLGLPYIDNDLEMSAISGFSIEELSSLPIPELHKLEANYLINVLDREMPLIAGAAGSIGDREDLMQRLKSVYTIYLHIPLGEALIRVGTKGVGRQVISGTSKDILIERYERRDPRYRASAKLIVDLTESPENDAKLILQNLI